MAYANRNGDIFPNITEAQLEEVFRNVSTQIAHEEDKNILQYIMGVAKENKWDERVRRMKNAT